MSTAIFDQGLDEPDSRGAQTADGTAVLALELLFLRVQALFVSDGTDAQFIFGWREPPRQLARSNRLVWVPGDAAAALGPVGAPTYPGRGPQRALAGLWERFTVYLLAADVAAPHSNDDEWKQYRAARFLFDALVRAMAKSMTLGVNVRVDSATWITDKNERRFGAGIQVSGAILAVIPDSPVQMAPLDVHAVLASTELSQTDPPVTVYPTESE